MLRKRDHKLDDRPGEASAARGLLPSLIAAEARLLARCGVAAACCGG